MQVRIRFASFSVEAEIFDTPTGKALLESLPLARNASRWGQEIYFEIPFRVDLESDAQADVEVGDLAYWPNMPAFCIFYGPTPVSSGQVPRAASPVNVFGRLLNTDPTMLDRVAEGENISVELLS